MNNKTYIWKTSSVLKETGDTMTIIFETDGECFTYKAGQFLNVQQKIGEEIVSRSYSLSSSPATDDRPAITIKKVQGGKMGNHVFQNFESIQKWKLNGPLGAFHAEPSSMNEKLVVLIGGGSGITPLYSILKTLLKSSNATIILFNCNRTWDDVVFLQGITYLEQEYSDRLQTFHFLSRETGNTDTGCKHIRREKLSKLVLRKLVKKLLAERVCEAEYFLCGPYGLTSLAIDVLESLEIPQTHIHIEHFVPIENGSAIFELPQTNKEVMLQYSEQKKLLVVHPSKSILEAALESGIYLRHSCKSGTCGKCVAKQKSGKLHMMQNYALTEEELNQGYVLLCQSHPLDDKVTIVIE